MEDLYTSSSDQEPAPNLKGQASPQLILAARMFLEQPSTASQSCSSLCFLVQPWSISIAAETLRVWYSQPDTYF